MHCFVIGHRHWASLCLRPSVGQNVSNGLPLAFATRDYSSCLTILRASLSLLYYVLCMVVFILLGAWRIMGNIIYQWTKQGFSMWQGKPEIRFFVDAILRRAYLIHSLCRPPQVWSSMTIIILWLYNNIPSKYFHRFLIICSPLSTVINQQIKIFYWIQYFFKKQSTT